MTNWNKRIARLLEGMRIAHEMTRPYPALWLAEQLGVTPGAVCRWAKGNREPSTYHQVELVELERKYNTSDRKILS